METSQSCKNCASTYEGQFCNHCGQKRIEERWTLKRLTRSAFSAILNLEKGFFYTFKNLFFRPGGVIKDYINGNTVQYSNPFRYTLIAVAASAFLTLSIGVWEHQVDGIIDTYKKIGLIADEAHEQATRNQMKIVTQFLNIIPFLLLPFISLGTHLLLKKQKLHYAEHLILNTYMLGQITLYGLVNILFMYFVPSLSSYAMLFGIILAGIVYSQIFKEMFNKEYLEGIILGVLSYIVGFFFFLIAIAVISIITTIILVAGFGWRPAGVSPK